jgi:predicted lipid-binding transport protein (Tim44 family)
LPDRKAWERQRLVATFIASPDLRTYVTAMHRYFLQIVALLGLVMMPFGMAASPAAANTAPAAGAGHCADDSAPVGDPAKPQAHCASCSAVPAIEATAPAAGLLPKAQRVLARSNPISDIQPETATPPPKFS